MGAGVGGWNQLSGPTNLAALQCVVNATPSHPYGIEVYRAEFSQMGLGVGTEEWKRFQASRQSKYKHLVTNHRVEASATADFPGKDRLCVSDHIGKVSVKTPDGVQPVDNVWIIKKGK